MNQNHMINPSLCALTSDTLCLGAMNTKLTRVKMKQFGVNVGNVRGCFKMKTSARERVL